jgi:AraC family transcriptional regulator of adaptative response/methylated-DNA-[protein]-cysteine methyltransferase
MKRTLSFQQKYRAICRRDSSYVGILFTAVKTTGVFCLPTCTARKPRPQNVEFFDSAREAIVHGYRPCKVCKPLQPAERVPDDVENLLKELQDRPELRLTDRDIRRRGIEPTTIRRWFQKHHKMTFHTFQRMLRLNRAYQELNNGKRVSTTAFSSGYESLSGFGESFRATFGAPPSQSAGREVIHLTRFATPLGAMVACATEKGVCLCEFSDRRMLESELHDLKSRLRAVILPSRDNSHLLRLEAELEQYFSGTLRAFDVALDTPASEFRQRVWNELRTIPYAQTRGYAEQARRIGKPAAVRAVAAANGHNRIAIVIPCHRVIGSNGSLTGYGGGLARKQWLLDFEKDVVARNEAAAAG